MIGALMIQTYVLQVYVIRAYVIQTYVLQAYECLTHVHTKSARAISTFRVIRSLV